MQVGEANGRKVVVENMVNVPRRKITVASNGNQLRGKNAFRCRLKRIRRNQKQQNGRHLRSLLRNAGMPQRIVGDVVKKKTFVIGPT